MAMNDDNGEKFIHEILPIFAQDGVCLNFLEIWPVLSYSNDITEMVVQGLKTYHVIMNSTVNVVVVHGEIDSMVILRMFPVMSKYEGISWEEKGKVWIMTTQMDFTSLPFQRSTGIDFLHGALSFSAHSETVSGFQDFLQTRSPTLERDDGFIRVFWEEAFQCSFRSSRRDGQSEPVCTGEEKLETLPTSVFEMEMTSLSYSIYNAVYALAHALDDMPSSPFKSRGRVNGAGPNLLPKQPWKVKPGTHTQRVMK